LAEEALSILLYNRITEMRAEGINTRGDGTRDMSYGNGTRKIEVVGIPEACPGARARGNLMPDCVRMFDGQTALGPIKIASLYFAGHCTACRLKCMPKIYDLAITIFTGETSQDSIQGYHE
jgi:hypothetical protein